MSEVYFIRPIGMASPVKIGRAIFPKSRRTALATWSPFDLEIVATIPGGRDLEERFHALFIAHHWRQEWFHGSELMEKVINQINSGTFDIGSLPESLGILQHALRYYKSNSTETEEYRKAYALFSAKSPDRLLHMKRPPLVPCRYRIVSDERKEEEMEYLKQLIHALGHMHGQDVREVLV
jgi:hypothetical protein